MSMYHPATAPCDDCGKPTPVADDHPVDWTYCPACLEIIRQEAAEVQRMVDNKGRASLPSILAAAAVVVVVFLLSVWWLRPIAPSSPTFSTAWRCQTKQGEMITYPPGHPITVAGTAVPCPR